MSSISSIVFLPSKFKTRKVTFLMGNLLTFSESTSLDMPSIDKKPDTEIPNSFTVKENEYAIGQEAEGSTLC